MFLKNAISRASALWLALAVFLVLAGSACYIPGIIEPAEATDPPEGTVSGEAQIFYGKFVIYQINGGKLKNLKGEAVDYFVGDEVFRPNNNKDNANDYNIYNNGNESFLTYHYKDTDNKWIVASGRPETILVRNYDPNLKKFRKQLAMYYTDARLFWDEFGFYYENAWDDQAGDTPGTAKAILSTGRSFIGSFAVKGDVDYYSFTVTDTLVGATPQPLPVMVSIQGRLSQLRGLATEGNYHRLRLRLLAPDGVTELARSSHGVDFWKFVDPDMARVLNPGTYYIEVTDVRWPQGDATEQSFYRILIEASNDAGIGHIKKGELQPARSCVFGGDSVSGCGNNLRGGPTFEPDNLDTEVRDVYPDCDGIPGNGNEGDAGINELCGGFSDYGARDGSMQYQEVDNKTTIEDGEYFVGKPTNVPAFVDTEASIIKTPLADGSTADKTLSMFVAYNTGIYWLESLDGETGLVWDLTNLQDDKAAVKPLSRRGMPGNLKTPVVTSGILGFCDTVPAAGDVWAAPELQQFADTYGTTGTANGVMTNSPSGYPNTIAVTFGGNGYLDSQALVDEQVGNTIHTGPDGIINTFFAPTYVAYPMNGLMAEWYPLAPQVFPGNTLTTYGMNGPGVPDNPPIYDSGAAAYVYPLAGLGGDDDRAFLLGDDDTWNTAIFHGDTLNPAQYWRKQHCHYYSIGYNFDRCAMGMPQAPNGEEPVSILSGNDGRLKTVDYLLEEFRGDDTICHDGATVGICPGPDGRFGWQDVYIPVKGDDKLTLVHDGADTTAPLIVGISSGLDGVLQTTIFSGYTLLDAENFSLIFGGDYLCKDQNGNDAICPGNNEYVQDHFLCTQKNAGVRPPGCAAGWEYTGTRRLMSIWPMYITAPFNIAVPIPGFEMFYLVKKDIYNVYDDEFCIIDGAPAICPGKDGVFQSYPLSQRVEVDSDDDLFVLHDRVQSKMKLDCYSLRSELYRDDYSEKEAVRFVFYHDLGIRMDDRVRWSPTRGYYVSTGRNGINQSCTENGDERVIPMWQGLPDQPIISGGVDGLETYPLKDERFKWADGVPKISSGPDGIANSYIRGDDRLEIFMGSGKAEQPCVRSGDGYANTNAQNYNSTSATPIWTNDHQLYEIGDATGFDAYEVFGPKAVAVDGTIYLYYSALGAEEFPVQFRSSSGALGDLGECRRPGADLQWGRKGPDFSMRTAGNTELDIYNYDLKFFNDQFRYLFDNNEGVGTLPRIGVATSNMRRLRADPTDWDVRTKPALDVGQQCTGSMSFPISLPLSLPGMLPDSNFYGAFSPEIEMSTTPEGEQLFLMFYSGLVQGEQDGANLEARATVGLARSLDGIKWEVVRDFKNVISASSFDLNSVIGAQPHMAFPAVYEAGEDEFGQTMYGMFYNQFANSITSNTGVTSLNVDLHTQDHIGWALRRGMSYLSSCSMSPENFSDSTDRNRRVLQLLIFAIPVALAGIFSISRRRNKK